MSFSKNKICFLGEAGVGKTSLISLLRGEMDDSSNDQTKPTIGLEIKTSNIGDAKCTIWDLAGQRRFKAMWDDFLKNSGLAVLVCDSTEKNLEKTKELYNRYAKRVGAKMIAIANKQDLPGALGAEIVQENLGGIPTYEMSAIKKELSERMREILEYELTAE